MKNLKMYCLTLNPEHLKLIKAINYIPVGLGNSFFNSEWVTDKFLNGIDKKNPFYGEYTFHYYLWKNANLENQGWIGFCQYRKFWILKKLEEINFDFQTFNSKIIHFIPQELEKYDVILGEEMFINKFRFKKFIKRNFKKMILNPSLFFYKKKRNLKFHFDMWHGDGNLEKAISLLENSEKKDFSDFVNQETSFNPHNMFICKNKKILFDYYESVFPWLEKCEKIFGFENLKGYGLQRIYGFLAERYMSYWFKKYYNCFKLPIYFKDIGDYKL